MTDAEMNVAIAEACGWRHANVEETSFADPTKTIQHKRWQSPLGVIQRCCPNYCHDLNAMHEAEKTLAINTSFHTLEMPQKWYDTIIPLCKLNLGGYARATARQRAEAFLRTLDKWREKGGAK